MSSDAAALPSALDAVVQRLGRTRDLVASVSPRYVLGGLLLVQWLAVLALALTVEHNGWLYYAGGDQLWHYSGAHLMAHGHLPPTFVGYGWSFLLMPIAAVAGPNLVSALPAIVLLNVLVLLPVALLCVYGIAARIAGRVFGYFAAGLWIGFPYLGIVIVEPGYHQKYTELTLPQVLGLASVPDFPATVALLVSAYFCLRALDSSGWHVPVAAGLAAGYSIAIKPSNAIFLLAPAVLLVVEKRRALLPFAAGLAPVLLTLALWKYRGLGELAAAPAEPVRLAGGIGGLLDRIHNPEDLNSWAHFRQVLDALREHFWAARVIEWLPVAGAIGLLARSRRGFLLVVTWFAVYVVTKATYLQASVEDASFWRILMPSFPAYLLLAAAVVLLVPGVRARPELRAFSLAGRRLTVVLGAALVVFALLPLGVIAATPPLKSGGRDAVMLDDNLLPVSSEIRLRTTREGQRVRLSWHAPRPRPASVFYRVMIRSGPNDVSCAGSHAAEQCRLYTTQPAATRTTSYTHQPGPGTWTYRIGVSANWLDDPRLGDVYVLSPPVTVTVP